MDLMNVLVTSQYLRQIGGAGGNGSGSGADWNASEGEAGYIKNKPSSVSDDEFLEWLNEAKVVEPVVSTSGEVYTTNDNQIYIL